MSSSTWPSNEYGPDDQRSMWWKWRAERDTRTLSSGLDYYTIPCTACGASAHQWCHTHGDASAAQNMKAVQMPVCKRRILVWEALKCPAEAPEELLLRMVEATLA